MNEWAENNGFNVDVINNSEAVMKLNSPICLIDESDINVQTNSIELASSYNWKNDWTNEDVKT